jgi:hypothetical protein
MKKGIAIICMIISLSLISGCSLFDAAAPALEATPISTQTVALPTPTTEPTMGELEYIDAVYCWVSHIDDAEFNLIRFFPSGNLIDVFVQGYGSCEEAWQKSAAYLTEDKLMNFNHGEYQLSNEWIIFTLSAANSEEVVGEVKGDYSPERMLLTRQGSEQMEYLFVNMGE